MNCPNPASQGAMLAHFVLADKCSLASPLLLFPKNVADGSIFREPCFLAAAPVRQGSKSFQILLGDYFTASFIV